MNASRTFTGGSSGLPADAEGDRSAPRGALASWSVGLRSLRFEVNIGRNGGDASAESGDRDSELRHRHLRFTDDDRERAREMLVRALRARRSRGYPDAPADRTGLRKRIGLDSGAASARCYAAQLLGCAQCCAAGGVPDARGRAHIRGGRAAHARG